MKLTYSQQLRHPNWQRRRLEMLTAAGWKCEICEDTETMFHVHHRRYIKGRMAWEYENSELAVLCKNCHQDGHEDEDDLNQLLASVPIVEKPISNAISLLAGFFGCYSEKAEAFSEKNSTYTKFVSIGFIASQMRGLTINQLCEVINFVESLQVKVDD